jgi:hypothetical protein
VNIKYKVHLNFSNSFKSVGGRHMLVLFTFYFLLPIFVFTELIFFSFFSVGSIRNLEFGLI